MLEIRFTSTPVHPSARVLNWKSMASPDCDGMSTEELRKASLNLISDIDTKPIQVARFEC